MTAITRRSLAKPFSAPTTLAAADDLNGDSTLTLDVSGSKRVLIIQDNIGTAGTAGIDVIEVSHDGGTTWAVDDTVLAIASDDNSGTILASGALNAAGVEPTTAALFKSGPYEGPTLIRCSRGVVGTGTAWVTGAPKVSAATIG